MAVICSCVTEKAEGNRKGSFWIKDIRFDNFSSKGVSKEFSENLMDLNISLNLLCW